MKDRYFSHDCNALNDNKITELRSIYGMEGYGVYWAIVESLSREEAHTLEMSKRKFAGMTMVFQQSFELEGFINDCVEIGLFQSDGERFWSASVFRRLKEAEERSKARQKAAKARWSGSAKEQDKTDEQESSVYDPAWKRVMDAYQTQLGILPMGRAGQELITYVDDMGADAVIVAIERTNEAQPANAYPYLRKILESMLEKDVHNGEEARAFCLDFDRKKNNSAAAKKPTDAKPDDEEVRWVG